MRVKIVGMGALACLAAIILTGYLSKPVIATGPIPTDCDRACLEGLADQYLNAVVAHDPKTLPLAQDVKYTEQDQVMDVGDGFWGTATAVGHFRAVLFRSRGRADRLHRDHA